MVRTTTNIPKSNYEMYGKNSYQIQKLPERKTPTLENFTLENVQVIAGKLMLNEDKIIPVSNYRQEKSVHAAGFLKKNSDESYRVIKTVNATNRLFQQGLFVGSSTSWFHFMIECVPRLMSIPEKKRYGVPVILPKDTPQQIVRLCEILTRANPIFVELLEGIQVQEIHIGRESGVIDPLEFSFRKQKIKEAISEIQASVGQSKSPKIFSDKIYVQRPKGLFRPLQNERAIRRMLEKQGFKTVRPEDLPLDEVVNIFSNANLIIAESGAAITNVLFTKPGAGLIELYPGKGPTDFWPELASISKVEVTKVFSVPAPMGPKGVARDGIYISKAKLRREIKHHGKIWLEKPSNLGTN
jgi:hypothetical protein